MEYNFYNQILMLSALKLLLFSLAYGREGVCKKQTWIDNEQVELTFCCAFYEMIHGTCISCEIGYFSINGSKCHPCTGQLYGLRCLHKCDCTVHQTCHHVEGCTHLQSTTSEDSINVDSWMTKPGSEFEEVNSTESNQEPAPFNHNILHLIYSVCITGLVVVIAICYICIHRLKNKKTEQTQNNSSQENEIQNALILPLPFHENAIRLESIYDEIDEFSLHNSEELPSTHRNVVSESSSEKTSECEMENLQNDEYFNPYQPIVEDSKKHDYKTLNVSSSNLDRNKDSNVVHKGNVESLLHNVTADQYLDVILDPRYEYPINTCVTSSSAYDSSNHLHKQVQCADIINKQTSENLQTSMLNRSHSNKDNLKEDKENRKLSSSVPIKRLTI